MNHRHLLRLIDTNCVKYHVAVVLGDCHRKSGIPDFFTQHVLITMQIRAVGDKAVWDSGELVNDPCGGRRMAGKMCMNMVNLQFLHAMSHRHALWENGQRTNQKSTTAQIRPNQFAQRPEPQAGMLPHRTEIISQNFQRQQWKKVSPFYIRRRFSMHLRSVFPMERKHFHICADFFCGQHFVQDKGLGDFRKPRHHVGNPQSPRFGFGRAAVGHGLQGTSVHDTDS